MLTICWFSNYIPDLYADGGFDGGFTYFFALLAEDSQLRDSNECVFSFKIFTSLFYHPEFTIWSFRVPATIGFALCNYSYSTTDGRIIYLRNFLVQDVYRSKGVGQSIFQKVLKHAKVNACRRIELHVSDWNTSAQKFYKNAGAINITERDGDAYYRFFKDVINKIDA